MSANKTARKICIAIIVMFISNLSAQAQSELSEKKLINCIPVLLRAVDNSENIIDDNKGDQVPVITPVYRDLDNLIQLEFFQSGVMLTSSSGYPDSMFMSIARHIMHCSFPRYDEPVSWFDSSIAAIDSVLSEDNTFISGNFQDIEIIIRINPDGGKVYVVFSQTRQSYAR